MWTGQHPYPHDEGEAGRRPYRDSARKTKPRPTRGRHRRAARGPANTPRGTINTLRLAMGKDKWDSLGMNYQLADTKPPKPEDVEKIRDVFRSKGLEVY